MLQSIVMHLVSYNNLNNVTGIIQSNKVDLAHIFEYQIIQPAGVIQQQ